MILLAGKIPNLTANLAKTNSSPPKSQIPCSSLLPLTAGAQHNLLLHCRNYCAVNSMERSPLPLDLERGSNYMAQPPTPPPHYRPMQPPPPQPPSWFPWLMPLAFVANVGMFVYTMYLNDCPSTPAGQSCLLYKELKRFSFQPLKENILIGPTINTLKDIGGLERGLVIEEGEKWRLLTSMWLHAGLIHLIANMLSLLIAGIRLEKDFGFIRIGVLYLLSGLAGSFASLLYLNPSNSLRVSVGASGALFGFLGSMLSDLLINWTIYTNKICSLINLLIIIALNLAIGFIPFVDNSAHIGGFIAGFFLGFVILIRPQYGYVSKKYLPPSHKLKTRHAVYQYVLFIIGLVASIVGYSLCSIKLFGSEEMKKMVNYL